MELKPEVEQQVEAYLKLSRDALERCMLASSGLMNLHQGQIEQLEGFLEDTTLIELELENQKKKRKQRATELHIQVVIMEKKYGGSSVPQKIRRIIEESTSTQ